jgi:hypothetical protein
MTPTPDDDDFEEFDQRMKAAERAASALRSNHTEPDLRTLAQTTGQRYLACQDRLRRIGEQAAKASPYNSHCTNSGNLSRFLETSPRALAHAEEERRQAEV